MANEDKFIPDELHEKFQIIRRVIEHEDNLINHRFSWLIVAQSFLLAACICLPLEDYPLPIILAGLASAFFTYGSIIAAVTALEKIRRKVKSEFGDYYPHIISNIFRHYLGLTGAILVPPFFIGIWIWTLFL